MKAEIIAVGTELLLGQIVNTNARFLSEKLAEQGIDVFWHVVVGDNAKRLEEALRTALSRADLIVVSGGLGPTMDDITRETTALVLGLPLEKNKDWEKKLVAMFEKMERPMSVNNLKQALVPQGARILENRHGTAPGLWIERDEQNILLLPGPPRELEPMFIDALPLLKGLAGDKVILSRVLKITGLGESAVEELITDLLSEQINPTIAPLAQYSEVHLRLTAKANTLADAEKMLDELEGRLRERLGEAIFARDGESFADVVAGLLSAKKMTLAVAESCTGGLLAHWLTNVPGSSDYFLQGVVSYSNRAKIDLLGIKPALLREHGAVAEETARAMAENMRRRAGSGLALAITGIAGPTGGSAEKPVGLVYIALAAEDGVTSRRFNFPGKRENIKERAATAALNMIRLYLNNNQG